MAKKYSGETIDYDLIESSEYQSGKKESAQKEEATDFDIPTDDYAKTAVKVEIVEYEIKD